MDYAMSSLLSSLGFIGNPFEHYTAELEPNIALYAVKPPYLTAIFHRAMSTSSYLLFGDRGAGKSATRMTLYQEVWKKHNENGNAPLAINFIDFSKFDPKNKGVYDERIFISEVAFLTIESLLAWLSSLEDSDREKYTSKLDHDEKTLLIGMLQAFYISRSENERHQTIGAALKLLNQAWTTKSHLWINQKWSSLSGVFSSIVDLITKKYISDSADIANNVDIFLKSLGPDQGVNSRIVLEKLVELVKIFDFSGVVVLVDKVDETEFTQNSTESATKLVHPLLSHIQLLEVPGFAWQLFLWSKIKPFFESGPLSVRLDKIACSSIEWDDAFFIKMIRERLKYFSSGKVKFEDLLEDGLDGDNILRELIETSVRSPRELIRLLDVIIVEHDIRHADDENPQKLSHNSIELGQDKYVKDRIHSVYDQKILSQIYRLASIRFTNKDIQAKFKINSQSARNKIKSWEDLGIVHQTGTRAADGEQGGKPSYEYSILDGRVSRIISRRLISLDSYEEDSLDQENEDIEC
ncbi:hypothetical protein JK176_10335 [Gluconobacter sp. Dm-73]|uniref:P-loop ATPase, Sll1717 family n=1 Tax=Gluconobacter sp. Dm-73 TaxID=2799802 RepID=UPI001B8BB04C|nr:hypothetical protein [Gluconobacter sp. Dm-73]MBS1075282.1 hypothetical protein [Gluconobacter sp. Dm-73]